MPTPSEPGPEPAGPPVGAPAVAASDPDGAHHPPEGSQRDETWDGAPCSSRTEWVVLRDAASDDPLADVFVVSYTRTGADPATRPVTFVFNGGPGASSAYLHVGAVGPRRVDIAHDGTLLPPPVRLVDNAESWLAFTDLVIIDPVGTGFSRAVRRAGPGTAAANGSAPASPPTTARHATPHQPPQQRSHHPQAPETPPDPAAFFGVRRDLEAMGETIVRWLSRHDRWLSPVVVAGESYGGFRVARLVRLLQESYGVGLNGAVLISPALDFTVLESSDYDVLPWVDRLPTMAATAAFHGRSRAPGQGHDLEALLAEAAAFATGDYARLLLLGSALPDAERAAPLSRLADLLGLPEAQVVRAGGRIRLDAFVRGLLRDEGRVVGRYDATITAPDPFPDRDGFEGPDPTLVGLERVFAAGINQRLRVELGQRTDRRYHLLSLEVNEAWRLDEEKHALDVQVGAVDELRYGMALNPHLQVYVTHGRFDLVTPYYASERIRHAMRLDPALADNLTVRHFGGGHMFYAWRDSRIAFRDAMAGFYARATGLAGGEG